MDKHIKPVSVATQWFISRTGIAKQYVWELILDGSYTV